MVTDNCLRRHSSQHQIILRGHAEGICNPIEEGEHRDDVHRFRDLIFTPSRVAQLLHILGRGAVRLLRNQRCVVQQSALGGRKPCAVKIPLLNRFYCLITGSLNPQEVGMAVQSIRASVQIRHVARDHFLMSSREVTLGKMDCV